MFPQPKYCIGQTVYYAYLMPGMDTEPCPDCCGTAKWSVVLPSGETFLIRCTTCRFNGMPSGQVRIRQHPKPDVKILTIGSIRIDTNDKDAISYMCVETGVGSGTCYPEYDFFSTIDEANRAANAKADAMYRKIIAEEVTKPDRNMLISKP